MQVTVTENAFVKRSKIASKSVIATILIFIFAFISIVVLIAVRKKTLVFEEQYFYFVCADSSKKVSVLDNEKEYLKNIGGAAVTHFYKEDYYLVANVYLSPVDAEEIKGNIISDFVRAETVVIKSEKISKKVKNIIKQSESLLKFAEFIYKFNKELCSSSLDFYSGKIAESEFISAFITKNLKFDELKKSIVGEGEVYDVFKEYSALFALQLTSFLNNFYVAKNKQHYVSAYYVGFVINYLEFYDSLKIS